MRGNRRRQPFAIEVYASDGGATPTASVESSWTRTEAERKARSVAGVKAVVNQLSALRKATPCWNPSTPLPAKD